MNVSSWRGVRDGYDHGGGVRECGKVRQLSGDVTVLREV